MVNSIVVPRFKNVSTLNASSLKAKPASSDWTTRKRHLGPEVVNLIGDRGILNKDVQIGATSGAVVRMCGLTLSYYLIYISSAILPRFKLDTPRAQTSTTKFILEMLELGSTRVPGYVSLCLPR